MTWKLIPLAGRPNNATHFLAGTISKLNLLIDYFKLKWLANLHRTMA